MASQELITGYTDCNITNLVITQFKGNTYFYVFAGRCYPWSNNDTTVLIPNNVVQNIDYGTFRDMVFGKQISDTNISAMIVQNSWGSGNVYQNYDDTLPFSTNTYVSVSACSDIYVFKCLYNNGNIPSTITPNFADTSANDSFYQTSDGYQWKYMFTVNSAQYATFGSVNFLPVVPDANVVGNSVPGTIDVILVPNTGLGYANWVLGQFNAPDIEVGGSQFLYNVNTSAVAVNNYYVGCLMYLSGGTGKGQYKNVISYTLSGLYKQVTIDSPFAPTPDTTTTYEIYPSVTIYGDGNQTINAAARAIVNGVSGNSIAYIDVLHRGAHYSYAQANIAVNPVVSLQQAAVLRPIISPKNGHGFDVQKELGGNYIGISLTFSNSEGNTISTQNGYRNIGILINPLYANVVLELANVNGNFVNGEKITQANTNANGILVSVSGSNIQLTNCSSFLVTGTSSFGVISGNISMANAIVSTIIVSANTSKSFKTFDSTTQMFYGSQTGNFDLNEQIQMVIPFGLPLNPANATVQAIFGNSSVNYLKLTNVLGVFLDNFTIKGQTSGTTAVTTNIIDSDLVLDTGNIMYTENISVVNRSDIQNESLVFVIKL